ncbi:hypothetical protein Prum_070600 [Phytohabitans rumicis]|uniref:Uncharacterized protein n=1 Tax=Phytohabitans rumicis TaxID=1076125 RepID=A0A6V8LEP2_9ACTN|nr:hypothetical protein Prum_070600 [Phytohabitans rumicis]
MPMNSVTAKPVVADPATTINGAAAAITQNTTAPTPSRFRAKVVDTLLTCRDGGPIAVIKGLHMQKGGGGCWPVWV